MLSEAEDAEGADDARDAQVIVVEALDPVLGSSIEVVAEHDVEIRTPGLRPGRFEPVEVKHAG